MPANYPPELKEEIRRLKPQLLSELRNKNRADYDPVVAKALELFGGSVVKVMSVEEYQQRFNTSFPGYTRPRFKG